MKNKKMIIKSLLLIASCLLAVNFMAAAVKAEIPEMINIQGVLTQDGQPVTGEVTLVFRFFEIGEAKKPIVKLPSITKKAAIAVVDPDEAGFFNVAITPEGINFTTPYEVEIAIQGQDPFLPRQPLLSVPYAYTAKNGEKGFTVWGEAAFKAVNVATVDPGAGKMLFDNGSKRMMYHDGTQWIQIDPAYTTSSVLSTPPQNAGPINEDNIQDFSFTVPNDDIIVTAISGWIEENAARTYLIKLTHGDNSGPEVQFYTTIRSQLGVGTGSTAGNGNFYFELPIPVKYDGNKDIKVTIQCVSGGQYFNYNVNGLSVQYIVLPL